MQNAVDDEAGGFLLEVDAIVTCPVAVEGPVRAFYRAESVGVAGEKVGGENIEFPKHLDLQGGGELADLRGAGGGENDLEGRHARKFKFKFYHK